MKSGTLVLGSIGTFIIPRSGMKKYFRGKEFSSDKEMTLVTIISTTRTDKNHLINTIEHGEIYFGQFSYFKIVSK